MVRDPISVDPGSTFCAYFSFGGGVRCKLGSQEIKLEPTRAYEITFRVPGPMPAGDKTYLAHAYGQQLIWDIGCWPWVSIVMGRTTRPETEPHLPANPKLGSPCYSVALTTSPVTGKINVGAKHFSSVVDMNTMMGKPPQPTDEMVLFAFTTDAVTPGLVTIL